MRLVNNNMYVILGCGTAGYIAAKLLKDQKKGVVIVDINKERVESLREAGFDEVIEGDITSKDVLKKAGIEKASAVLILTKNMETNKKAVKAVREINSDVPIIVRGGAKGVKNGIEEDVDVILYPTEVLAEHAVELLEKIESMRKIRKLRKIIADSASIAIVIQDNPDPDAIASAMAFKYIVEREGRSATIIYGGEVGHEENKALVNLLQIRMEHISSVDLSKYSKIALIESSIPGVNNSLPPNYTPAIVIDHHQVDIKKVKGEFVDIRPEVGANSSILTEYLILLDLPIDETLATALLYGIKTDTSNFMRGLSELDIRAISYLYPKANHDIISRIEKPTLSMETLDVLANAIKNRKIKGSYLISNVGFIRERDTLPQAAEYLLNLEGILTTLIFGIAKDAIYISGRTKDIRINLGEIMQKAFGDIGHAGGHSTAAAAKIPLGLFGSVKDRNALLKLVEEAVIDRFFNAVGLEEKV